MNKETVRSFFDERAERWDDTNRTRPDVIRAILDCAQAAPGRRILDVACGTGVLFPYYLAAGVTELSGLDFSPLMLRRAAEKFPDIPTLCEDAETFRAPVLYDSVVVYNAYPHFPDPDRLIANLAAALREGGRLTVAHGASRAEIERCHEHALAGPHEHISRPLESAAALSERFAPFFTVDCVIDDDEKYIVSGLRRPAAEMPKEETMHDHPHTQADENEQLALLEYMLHHNEHHLEEFSETLSALKEEGKDAAAQHLAECIRILKDADAELSLAIAALKEG